MSSTTSIIDNKENTFYCNHRWSYFKQDPKLVQPLFCEMKTKFVEQMSQVKAILRYENLINESRLDSEVDWYYCELGLSIHYFEIHSAHEIAEHVASLYSAKCLAHINGNELELQLHSNNKGRALFIARSNPGSKKCESIEHHIEQHYLGEGYHHNNKYSPLKSTDDRRYRLLCYRTKGTVSPDSDIHLRLYSLSEPKYKNSNPPPNETNFEEIADLEFLRNLDPISKNIYETAVKETVSLNGPSIKLYELGKDENDPTIYLVVGYRSGSTHSFFSGLTNLYHSFNYFSPRKYIEQFSNGVTVFNFQLYPRQPQFTMTAQQKKQIVEETSLIYILPRTSISPLFNDGILTAKEYAYAYAGWKFVFHFLSRQSAEFAELSLALKNDPTSAKLLASIKNVVRKETFNEGRIMESIFQYPHMIKELYKDFESRFLSYALNSSHLTIDEWSSKIQKTVLSDFDRQIFKTFVTFNHHILKTNFYKPSKVALSFRLDPKFLSKDDYPITPFAIFFVVGPEFRGFHVRFRDVARGGIRIIKSSNFQVYTTNVTTIFDENYNLASTQERKNKDIAEGGSKGTILLSLDHQDKAFEAFQKYVDSILDLLQLDNSVVDYYKKEEILFFGPDEGTAGFMDWASQHSKRRGYKFWKSFTTGKSPQFGGIPHDLYGMTTRSIHQYVLGVLKKLNIKESETTKLQTGGPDGDLGSNEIKISKDKTIAIVDGSGVLYDPEGINRDALIEVANKREMARKFNMSKLGPKGFFIDVDTIEAKLPDGTIVNGLDFRNNFHLHPLASAILFVPCGGRPESINVGNVFNLIDETTKKPKFQIIVEGANLFLTQEARLILEKHGCIIFKDASANKGGVTSSSLEVLAALALTDEEFEENMMVKDGKVPKFYREYVQEVHRIIEENAKLEFEAIWKESIRSGTPRSIISDILSNKINDLSKAISDYNLWNSYPQLRYKVLSESCPTNLLNLLGLETILKRVPENYIRAIFSSYLASRYVYQSNFEDNPEFSFFNFITKYLSLLN
jgi:glutamate dehydrogenase